MHDLTIAINAGGQSRRMGRDKSFVMLGSRSSIEHVLARARSFGPYDVMLITNSPDDYAQFDLPTFSDVIPDKGPLGGIYSALHHSPTEYTLVLPCDTPFLAPALFRYMIGLAQPPHDVIVPSVDGYPQGLHGIYRRTCREPILRQLEQDRLKVIGFYDEVNVRYVAESEYGEFDPDGRSFFNINTPDDLRRAHDIMAEDS